MSRRRGADGGPDGLLIVAKPAGMTSHDVVARVRRIAHTRRVGHAGTLDPMATGVLVLGLGRATRLLGHLALTRKSYEATIRLGERTVTDDAEGDVVARTPAGHLTDEAIQAGVKALTGEIAQVPATVSAIKVDGRRAYARARAGETVELAPRPVTIYRFDVLATRRRPDVVDLDVVVDCSSGTYVRALARDLGAALEVGGHLTVLRRTVVGPYTDRDAHSLDRLAELSPEDLPVMSLAEAVNAAFPRCDVDEAQARSVAHGGFLPATGHLGEPVGVFAPDGTCLALVADDGARAKPLAVFVTS